MLLLVYEYAICTCIIQILYLCVFISTSVACGSQSLVFAPQEPPVGHPEPDPNPVPSTHGTIE